MNREFRKIPTLLQGNRRRQINSGCLALVFCFIFSNALEGQSQAEAKKAASSRTESSNILATVAGFPIDQSRVEAHLRRTVPGWSGKEEWADQLRSEALEHLINRQVILVSLRTGKSACSDAEIQWRLDEIQTELREVDRDLNDFLTQTGQSLPELKNEIEWELTWSKYLEAVLTDERLQQHFDRHPRDFDGTEMRVAQILLARGNSIEDEDTVLAEAKRIHDDISTGRISWPEAVRQYSVAASKENQGELGWIRRYEPMPEEFSASTFELQPGEVSRPFASRFGIHLVKCQEVRPGKTQFQDARETVRRSAMKVEFERLASQNRPKTLVTYAEKRRAEK